MPEKIKTNPYGVSDFANLRRRNGYFMDCTECIPALEELPYQLFLRPRRFGKSLLVSMLEYYYDILAAERFDELFAGTWIHEHPTPFRHQFLVLHLDFSVVEGETLEELQRDFEAKCKVALDAFVDRYQASMPDALPSEVKSQPTYGLGMEVLKRKLPPTSPRVFIVIDEYDNFANHVLAKLGEPAYRQLCHGEGFFKGFFAILKAQNSVVTNIFLTGVSPMVLDDVTSGFNIARNISQKPQFATLCGFTHADVRAAMDYFAAAGQFAPDRNEGFRMVTEWYDHYRFSPDSAAQVINPTLFLGFLDDCKSVAHLPERMGDENYHTDYFKLQHLVTTNGKLNGKFQALERLMADGSVAAELMRSFQAGTLGRPESFLSLLFYYGMATIQNGPTGLAFRIPNLLMRQYIAEFIREGYADTTEVNPRFMELANLLGDLALKGNWRPAIGLAAEMVRDSLSARDLLDGEKAVQAAMAAYCAASNIILVHTEHRAGCGFADLALQPDLRRYPLLRFGALVEVKYLKKSEKEPTSAAKAKMLEEAKSQLEEYAEARNLAREWGLAPAGPVSLVRLCIVFHGETMLFVQEI